MGLQAKLKQVDDNESTKHLEQLVSTKEKEIVKLNSFIDDMERIYEDQETKIKHLEGEVTLISKEKALLESTLLDLNSSLIILKKEKTEKETILETELVAEKEKLLTSVSEFSKLKEEFLSLKSYKEEIEIEVSKNELILTQHSEKFNNLESELELMKIDVQNKDVSIVTLHKQLVEEKETLAEYISKLNINLDETKKELDSKCEEIQKLKEDNSKLKTEFSILKEKEIALEEDFTILQQDVTEKIPRYLPLKQTYT